MNHCTSRHGSSPAKYAWIASSWARARRGPKPVTRAFSSPPRPAEHQRRRRLPLAGKCTQRHMVPISSPVERIPTEAGPVRKRLQTRRLATDRLHQRRVLQVPALQLRRPRPLRLPPPRLERRCLLRQPLEPAQQRHAGRIVFFVRHHFPIVRRCHRCAARRLAGGPRAWSLAPSG